MKRVCAWCQTELESLGRDRHITHTICSDCLDNLMFQLGGYLRDYLDRLPVPVVLMGGEARVTLANRAACTLLGKTNAQVAGELGGVVFECAYARLPGGCGQTVHCSGCAIRRTVMATLADGKGRRRVPAALTRAAQADQRIDLWISTEKVGDYVLLQIDRLATADARAPAGIPGPAQETDTLRKPRPHP